MKPTKHHTDRLLDEALAAVKREEPAAGEIKAAAGRVWARLQTPPAAAETASPAHQIRGCADYQSLIPAHLERKLSAARALLLEDHTLECLPCRRALKDARAAEYGAAPPATTKNIGVSRAGQILRRPVVRFALAASIILVFGLAVVPLIQKFVPWGSGIDPVVQAVNGAVFLVDGAQSQTLAAGNNFKKGERIRTAKEAGAVVRLADGSLVEMRERSEFSVTENLQGTTINLDRGSIIVQAAEQRDKHLYVATDDCLISVRGTIFSVNSGMKGSRVSVAEGEVAVDHRGAKSMLRPGEQVTTSDNLERVPVREEFAWSREADRYAKLLAGLEDVRRNLETRVTVPGVRYSTRLLDLAPAETVLYVAIPNVSETVAQSYEILQERIAQNEALREWWQAGDKDRTARDAELKELVEKVRQFGRYVGSEVTVTVGMNADGRPADPLVVGELKDAAGFKEFLQQEMNRLEAKADGRPLRVRFVEDPPAAGAVTEQNGNPELYFWIRDDLFAISPRSAALGRLAANVQAPAANPFRESSFRASVADVYQHGAGLILAADLQKVLARSAVAASSKEDGNAATAQRAGAYDRLGLTTLKHLIVELKQQEGKGSNRAVLSFTEPRRGVASWLAAPGPMGALEYVSPEANMVAAFVVKEPTALVDDLLGTLQTIDPSVPQHLGAFERESGFDVRRDFAAPLGGEFAFAVDGPVLPSPSWKMILEVNEPARLQETLARVVAKLNESITREGRQGLQLTQAEESGGRTFYALKSLDLGLEINYSYVNGYLIMTPSRALLDRAIRYHDSGVTLARAPRFTATLPEDGNANFSALFYHHLAPLVAPLASRMGNNGAAGKAGEVSAKDVLSSLATASPTLAYAYAQGDQITVAANTDKGPFGLNPASFLGASNSFGMQHLLDAAREEGKSR